MFENVGSKIKVMSKIFFWLTVVLAVILLFTLGFTKEYYYYSYSSGYYTETNWPIIGASIGIVFDGYLISLLIYAAGEALEKLTEIEKYSKSTYVSVKNGLRESIKETEAIEAQEEELRKKAEEEAEKAEAERLASEKKAEEERLEAEKKAQAERNAQYWEEHAQEKEALLNKKSQAMTKIASLGIGTAKEKKQLQDLIDAIDIELNKDR